VYQLACLLGQWKARRMARAYWAPTAAVAFQGFWKAAMTMSCAHALAHGNARLIRRSFVVCTGGASSYKSLITTRTVSFVLDARISDTWSFMSP